jgi:hypothetical protein
MTMMYLVGLESVFMNQHCYNETNWCEQIFLLYVRTHVFSFHLQVKGKVVATLN